MDQSVNSVIHVKQEPLGNEDATSEQQPQNKQPTMTSSGRPLDQFCRLCLRQRADLVPRFSRVQDMTFSDVFRAITGLEMTLDKTYPLKMCRTCMELLDYAFDIRRNFIESYQILRKFVVSKTQPLITSLSDYQGGVRATRETVAERMLREYRDLTSQKETVDQHKATPKVNPYVGISPPHEEPVDPLVLIKVEPELIFEPEELPCSAATEMEMKMNDDEPSAEEFDKMHNVGPGNELDPNKCYICSQVFETSKEVQVHLLEHVDMVPYQCSECTNEGGQEVKIISLNRLQSHFRMHVSAIKCPEYPHRTQRNFHHHKAKHEFKTFSKCKYCGKKFKYRTNHAKHEKTHTENDGRTRTCKFDGCGFSTKNMYSYYRHTAKHNLRFQCPQCSQRFPGGRQLQRHQFVHTGMKKFPCERCDKSFQSKHSLLEHVAGHSNERPFACEICGKSFGLKRIFKRHMLKHSTQLSFECQHCDKKFSNHTSHARHEKTHLKAAVKLIDPDTDIAEETTARKTETVDADARETAPKLIPCIIIPQPQEDKLELPVQIKRE